MYLFINFKTIFYLNIYKNILIKSFINPTKLLLGQTSPEKYNY